MSRWISPPVAFALAAAAMWWIARNAASGRFSFPNALEPVKDAPTVERQLWAYGTGDAMVKAWPFIATLQIGAAVVNYFDLGERRLTAALKPGAMAPSRRPIMCNSTRRQRAWTPCVRRTPHRTSQHRDWI